MNLEWTSVRTDEEVVYLYKRAARKYRVPLSQIIREVMLRGLTDLVEIGDGIGKDAKEVMIKKKVEMLRRKHKFEMSQIHLGSKIMQRLIAVYYNNLGVSRRTREKMFRAVIRMAEEEYGAYGPDQQELCKEFMEYVKKFRDYDFAVGEISSTGRLVRSVDEVFSSRQKKVFKDAERLKREGDKLIEDARTPVRTGRKGKKARRKT